MKKKAEVMKVQDEKGIKNLGVEKMDEENLLELQRYYELGLIDEKFLNEETKELLKKLYKKQIEEKKQNLKIYREKISKYLRNK